MELWIMPLAGAAIGYCTNWLAVKMLFRPYRERRIFGKTLPFTPGLIPKERDKIARKIGETVSGHLLTEEMLAEKLLNANMMKQLEDRLTKKWESVRESDATILELLDRFFQKEGESSVSAIAGYLEERCSLILKHEEWKRRLFDSIDCTIDMVLDKKASSFPWQRYIGLWKETVLEKAREWQDSGVVADTIEKSLWQATLEATEREEAVGDYLSLEEIRAVKDYLSLKAPKAALAILTICEEPEIERQLREKLKQAIKGTTGSFVGLFVDTDHIYDKAVAQLAEYFENPENGTEIEGAIDRLVEHFLQYSVGAAAAAVKSEIRETGISRIAKRAADFLFDEKTLLAVMGRIEKAAMEQRDRTIGEILEEVAPGITDAGKRKAQEAAVWWIAQYGTQSINFIVKKGAEQCKSISIAELAKKISPSMVARGKAIMLSQIQNMIQECAPRIAASLDIADLIEKQVQSFDMERTEKLVLSVADKELRAITWIGGILGCIVGCAPFLLP